MAVNKYILRSTFVGALGGLLFGFDTAVISGTTAGLTHAYALSANQLGITVSIALWGTVIGALSAGTLGQKYGSREMLRLTAILYLISSIGCAIAPNWDLLLAARFLGGLGIGGSSVLGPVYIAEIAPARIRGTIVKIDGQSATIHARAGQDMIVALTPDTVVVAVSLTQFADVHPGSFIGTAAVPQPDGTLKALEVHIFPESMRGTGEGHRPWDLGPQSTMTNGTVGQIAGTDGRSFTVKYKDGEKIVTVPPDVPVVVFEPGTAGELAPGEHVVVTATKGADGALSASRVNFGKDGIELPL